MTFSRPTTVPNWATMDIADDVSKQNNVLPPPPEMQNYGWARQQFPPRQWFNWLGRFTAQWINYLAQQDQQSIVNDGTTAIVNTITGGLVTIFIEDVVTSSNYYAGIAYFPPGSASAVTINKINGVNLTVTTISTTGLITVGGGLGAGNYIVWAQTKTIP
jgi:hypothetical protein